MKFRVAGKLKFSLDQFIFYIKLRFNSVIILKNRLSSSSVTCKIIGNF